MKTHFENVQGGIVHMRRNLKQCMALLLVSTGLSTAAHAQTQAADEPVGDIIVTGTRATGMQAAESAAPIQLLSQDALTKVGQPNLNQALAQMVPSFTAQTQGTDMSNFALSARLRGLSPNHTLVMVNGKRRHNSALLQNLLGPYQGSAAPSIDLIPPDAVDHIEILQDGAAAQYGSDAIAGVVNIILKNKTSGGSARMSYGQHYNGQGDNYSVSGNIGLPIADNGYFDLTLFHNRKGYTYVGDGQTSMQKYDGTSYPTLTGAASTWGDMDLKNINGGAAKSKLSVALFNAGYDFGGVELYSFGDIASRVGWAKQGYRHPGRVCTDSSIPSRGGSGTYDPSSCFADTGTTGMVPLEKVSELEWSLTGGIKGSTAGFDWDLSTTYGSVKDKIYTLDSANISLYTETGFTPTDFYDGAFKFTQWTNTLDIRREFDAGLANPVTVAFGGEYRKENYQIFAGDPLSYYGSGAQSYPGYRPVDAGDYWRHSKSGYLNIIAKPVDAWTVDLAGRYEDYSDFGDTMIAKLTSRYDLSDAFAVRGTVSTGFRAPTMQESYYSATNVSPTSVTAQLPPNSAAAAALGFKPLKPEESTNYSAGIVLRPIPKLVVTLDGYYIKIRKRIVGTSTIYGMSGGVPNTSQTIGGMTAYDAVMGALNAMGVTTDGLSSIGAATFTNGVDTRTWGVDFVARYPVDLSFGKLDLALTGNYNDTKVTKSYLSADLYSDVAKSYLESASPKYKVLLSATLTSGRFSASLRQSYQGKSKVIVQAGGLSSSSPYFNNWGVVKATPLTDLELSYDLTDWATLSVGANNLFNKKPEKPALLPDSVLSTLSPGLSPYVNGSTTINAPYNFGTYGTSGGFYYARLAFKF